MDELLLRAFDFGIRVIELSSYLETENRRFALINRLLECGTGIEVCLRVSESLPSYRVENYRQAYRMATEAEYLFELMVKTGVVTQNQSRPILSDCRYLKDRIYQGIHEKSYKE